MKTRAFITLLAHAAKEGLRTGHLDLVAPNCNPIEFRTTTFFDAPLGEIPMRVAIGGWRFDEIRIAVAAWPTLDVDQWIVASNAEELAGEVTAVGHIARDGSGRLMISDPYDPLIFIRQARSMALHKLPVPSELNEPLKLHPAPFGYAAAAQDS